MKATEEVIARIISRNPSRRHQEIYLTDEMIAMCDVIDRIERQNVIAAESELETA